MLSDSTSTNGAPGSARTRTGAGSSLPPVIELTPRQADVVRELAHDGASNDRIAERLGLSVNTVKTHLMNAMARTGTHDRAELAVALVRRRVLIRRINRSHDPRRR